MSILSDNRLLALVTLTLGLCLTAIPALSNAEATLTSRPCVNTDQISVHCGEAPSAWQTEDGRLWVVFAQKQTAWLVHSDDEGDSFSEPVQINSTPEAIEVNGENRPKIIVDRRAGQEDVVYVSWTQKTAGMHTGDIRFSRSVNGGKNFEPVQTINDDGLLTSHRFDSLFLADSGHLYLSWLDKRELEAAADRGQDYAGSAVFYTVSSDQGASFAPNRKVADHSCECCRIAVAAHGDNGMALMWRQIFDGTARDHAIGYVSSEGASAEFSRASEDDWQINACPHHGPAMVQQGDEAAYHLSWFSAGNRHKGIYYGFHRLGDGETVQVQQIDGSPGAAHPQLAMWQDELLLVWKRFDGSKTELLLIRSTDQGKSWSESQVLATTLDASDHPLLVTGPRGPSVSWLTRAEGYLWLPLAENLSPATLVDDNSADIQPFLADTFAKLKAERAGQPFILALWSVDCPPCMVELQMLGRLKAENPDMPLILVSTDNILLREDATDFLIDFGLNHITSWMFADAFAERLHFSIDPQWYGELPRGYLFDAEHQAHAHSGIMSEQSVRDWLGM